MSDWLTGSGPVGPHARHVGQPTGGAPAAVPSAPWVLVGLQIVALIVGVVALSVLPTSLKLVGYVACGLVLPLLWALLFVSLKRQDLVHDSRTLVLEKLNRWLLLGGLVIGIWCAILVATEWAK